MPATEQVDENEAKLAFAQRLHTLNKEMTHRDISEFLKQEGTTLGKSAVGQNIKAYGKYYLLSPIIQALYSRGLITWGQLYNRCKRPKRLTEMEKTLIEMAKDHHPNTNFSFLQEL